MSIQGRVILYKGSFGYDAVNVFTEELAAGLAALGRRVDFVDITDKSGRGARLQEELARPFECIVSFAGIGFRPMSVAAGGHMYDQLSAPFVAVLVDHPSCALDRFGMENMIITCYDRSHVSFLKKYFDGGKRVEFLPHGGSASGRLAIRGTNLGRAPELTNGQGGFHEDPRDHRRRSGSLPQAA